MTKQFIQSCIVITIGFSVFMGYVSLKVTALEKSQTISSKSSGTTSAIASI